MLKSDRPGGPAFISVFVLVLPIEVDRVGNASVEISCDFNFGSPESRQEVSLVSRDPIPTQEFR